MVRSTNHEAPHYSLVSCPLLPHPSYARQLFQHPRQATGEIMILHISVYLFLDNKFLDKIPDRTVTDIPCFQCARIFLRVQLLFSNALYSLYITVSYIRSAHIRLVNTCLKVLVFKLGRCFARVVMYAHVILRK